MNEITLNAYAKINLSLVVTGRRCDGYHNIRSLMQGIDLFDVVKLSFCPRNATKYNLPHCTIDGVVVYLCTDTETIPADRTNLAVRGIEAVIRTLRGNSCTDLGDNSCTDLMNNRGIDIRKDYGITALRVDIHKLLPVSAGIAGGSGNAAACMLGLNAILGHPLTLRELMDSGAGVGADVPFSLFMNAYRNRTVLSGLKGIDESSSAAWIGGIGDIVKPAQPVNMPVILANPGIAVSTAAAYSAIDRIKDGGSIDYPMFVNDLELYTLSNYPEAARLKEIMTDELSADNVLMSGSGPTMIAYYNSADAASEDYSIMKAICEAEKGWRVWLTYTGNRD